MRLIFVLGVNLVVLAELCVAMAFASAAPERFTAVFLKVFFGLLVPTLLLAALVKRRIPGPDEGTGAG